MAKRRRKSTRRKAPKNLNNELSKAISAIKRAKTQIKRK